MQPRKSASRRKVCGIRPFRSKARPACASCATRPAVRLGIADDTLKPVEGFIIADQLLWNSGGRTAEIKRQASRTDAAAARIEERSEFVALNVSRAYIDYLLQQRLVAIAQDNATFHERLAGDLREGVARGSISVADQQQAEERLQAARARVTETQEDLDTAAIQFQTLTGVPIDAVNMPPDLSSAMPASLAEAEELARQNNPRVQESLADLNTARQDIKAAQAELGPRFNAEGTCPLRRRHRRLPGPHQRPHRPRGHALEDLRRLRQHGQCPRTEAARE